MLAVLNKIKNFVLDALFSPLCVSCRKAVGPAENFVCSDCLGKIKVNNSLFCPVCRARVPENKKICHFDCPYLLGAATDYGDAVIQNVIHFLKYKKIKSLSAAAGEIVLNYLKNLNLNLDNFMIVPVPLHKRKEFSRGFNQSRLIAENISNKFDLSFPRLPAQAEKRESSVFQIPVCCALKRIKNNKQQAGLND